MPSMVGSRPASIPTLEPSTDFPTAEDEAPWRSTRLLYAVLVGIGALLAGGGIGFALGRVTS